MNVLRIYDPEECDPYGVPLDWEECRPCLGTGARWQSRCGNCQGYGSLKFAALALVNYGDNNVDLMRMLKDVPPRCGVCLHPMSKGTWDGPAAELSDLKIRSEETGLLALRQEDGESVARYNATHYSRCDDMCRHGEPGRASEHLNLRGQPVGHILSKAKHYGVTPPPWYEATWRMVDVRPTGWAHDLRRHRLEILCLRCSVAHLKDPVRIPPLGHAPYLPVHNHDEDDVCPGTPWCPYAQWQAYVERFGSPFPSYESSS